MSVRTALNSARAELLEKTQVAATVASTLVRPARPKGRRRILRALRSMLSVRTLQRLGVERRDRFTDEVVMGTLVHFALDDLRPSSKTISPIRADASSMACWRAASTSALALPRCGRTRPAPTCRLGLQLIGGLLRTGHDRAGLLASLREHLCALVIGRGRLGLAASAAARTDGSSPGAPPSPC